MAIHARNDDGPITAINVTPLVDVMLVLLAIFMLTARLADSDDALPLDLPRAASGQSVQRVLHIAIAADGARRLDGVAIGDDAELRAFASRMQHQHPDLRTVIEASARAHHEDVIGVLDALRLAGISKIAFAVEPKPGAAPAAEASGGTQP